MAALDYLGPFCRQIGILTDALISKTSTLPVLKGEELNKGVVLELNEFRRSNNISWEQFYSWLCALVDNIQPLHTIQVKINRLESKLKELKRNKRQDALPELNSEPFFESPHSNMKNEQCPKAITETKAAKVSSFDVEVLSMANQKLAAELAATKESLDSEQSKTDLLAEKLSKVSVM